MMLLACAATSGFWASPVAPVGVSRAAIAMEAKSQAFKTPKSTDTAMDDQMKRLELSGLSPAEYEEATRQSAKAYLESNGAHIAPASAADGVQDAAFLKQLFGMNSIPAVPAAAKEDPTRVLATLYEIGGPLTNVLSTSVAKQLPLIPHVGIRVHGVEYFYSDHIEYRTVPVMEEMLGDRPQVTLDLGPATVDADKVQNLLDELEPDWEAKDYHVFDKNCVHFAMELADKITVGGAPRELMQGPLDVSERMLDSLPEWRRALGRRVMNEVTRLVVVSWGKASKEKKEAAAEKLGLDKGA